MDFEVHTPEAREMHLVETSFFRFSALGKEWLALCKQGPEAGRPQAQL